MSSKKTVNEKQGRGPMQEILLALGKRIRSERKGKGLSQEAFAEVCGLHRTEMGLLERGKTIPRLGTLLLVSQHLGLPIFELLQGIEP
jgi:transcriptional regulator with XRE-family HTH domain